MCLSGGSAQVRHQGWTGAAERPCCSNKGPLLALLFSLPRLGQVWGVKVAGAATCDGSSTQDPRRMLSSISVGFQQVLPEPRGLPCLCQPVPAEQWVLTPTLMSLEAQTLRQRAASPRFPMWTCLSHISPVPSSPGPPSSSLSPGTTHSYFRGGLLRDQEPPQSSP